MFNHAPGTVIQTSAGPIIIIDDSPGAGGEGQGYLATWNGRAVFYKAFHKSACPPYTPEQALALRKARTKALVKLGVFRLDARLNAPFAYSEEGGYVCDYIDNLMPLLCDDIDGPSFLRGPRSYAERVSVVAQLGHLLSLLHTHGIAHGDINTSNVGVVVDKNGLASVYLIDFGNYNSGDPTLPPMMAGSQGSMAYWIRAEGGLPDMKSDTYSFGIAAHELLLCRPVVAGANNIGEMLARLERGNLPGDPLLGRNETGHDIGFPFAILPPDLQSSLRLMLRPKKEFTPAIASFDKALHASLPNLFACAKCNMPVWWHSGRNTCPHCGESVGAALHLAARGHSPIPITGYLILGRKDLGNDAAVSEHHFRIQPLSPGRGHLEVLSINGIKRQRGYERVFAKQGQSIDVQAGDRIELGHRTCIEVI